VKGKRLEVKDEWQTTYGEGRKANDKRRKTKDKQERQQTHLGVLVETLVDDVLFDRHRARLHVVCHLRDDSARCENSDGERERERERKRERDRERERGRERAGKTERPFGGIRGRSRQGPRATHATESERTSKVRTTRRQRQRDRDKDRDRDRGQRTETDTETVTHLVEDVVADVMRQAAPVTPHNIKTLDAGRA
jgi:THO complex subunit 2